METKTSSSRSYLPLRALAEYSGLSVRTLRNHLVHASTPIPHYRIGGRVLVRRDEFDEWAARFKVSAQSNLDSVLQDVFKGL